jgi:hypothetical protein
MLSKSSFCLFGDNLKVISAIDDFIHQVILLTTLSPEILAKMVGY